ncbi:MAG: leucyl aminopeptidase, partial [Sedimentisphaerales bacterium]|nr:leucyl aminopeptidase [Sedimentisphaerales bacterium]
DKAVGGAIRDILRLGDFKGKANETTVLYRTGRVGCRRILMVGLGRKDKIEPAVLRQAAGTAARLADKLGAGRLGLALHTVVPAKIDAETAGRVLAEGAIVGRYKYQDYLSADKESKEVGTVRVSIVEPKAAAVLKLNRGRKTGTILGQGQNRARAVANKPGNEINPPLLGREAKKIARQFGLKCRVFNDRHLVEMGMNAILAVGGGSANKPRLIMLEHKGRKGSAARGKAVTGPDVVVVGKAITFDSGGISLKPSAKMEEMKFDKAGGCAVLGIMTVVAQLKLPLNVVGLIPTAENLPSQTSYRPGDIIRTYSGKTVEVQNTDAEGRMILSDALAYAAKMKPAAIIDMATLTGACVVALGEHNAGLFGNNDALKKKIEKAAEVSGEAVWAMPSGPEYLEQMKSKIADLKNTGDRKAGSCTAAAFLGEFVGDVPWVHIDIAAVADTDREKPWREIGATGFGVRLVVECIRRC